MEEDYQKDLEVIFAYGYGCCMFKHNICGSQLKVLDGMSDSSNPLLPEFFSNPRCPPALTVTEAATADVDMIEPAKDSEDNASVGDQG